MRIISGKYKGKKLLGFDIDGTRPTMDRVKESMFAMIQTNLKDAVCLDLFAGSGSLGIEAISNGASKCIFVEKNNIAYNILSKNLETLSSDEYEKHKIDYLEYFKKNDLSFDIIFLDPPYVGTYLNKSLRLINEYNILKEQGIIVCEHTEEIKEDYKIVKQKKYGNKKVTILSKNN